MDQLCFKSSVMGLGVLVSLKTTYFLDTFAVVA